MNDYDYEFYDMNALDNFEGEVSAKEFEEHNYMENIKTNNNIEEKLKKYSDSFKIKSKSSKELSVINTDSKEYDCGTISIYTATWNMYGKSASKTEIELLLPKSNYHHIYAIGTEECMRSILKSFFISDKSAWEKMTQEHLGPDYILIKSENMYAIHLMIFVHKSIVNYISHIGSNTVKTGFYNLGGNKGSVSVWFMYKNVSLLFINCHLAAGHLSSEKRNQDLFRILHNTPVNNIKDIVDKYNILLLNTDNNFKYKNKNSKSVNFLSKLSEEQGVVENKKDFPKLLYTDKIEINSANITDKFNVSFLMGDLNYRIDSDNFYISECIKMGNLKEIIILDQLHKERRIGSLNLDKFKEGEIKFNPTYKYTPGTNNYELGSSEKMPGWTDRILYKVQNLGEVHTHLDLKLINYFSINEVYLSDHKPVVATFELVV